MDITSRTVQIIFVVLVFILLIACISMPQTGIYRIIVHNQSAFLLQDNAIQILIGTVPTEDLLPFVEHLMPWFDHKIEIVILPDTDYKTIVSLLPLFDRYDVGFVVAPSEVPDIAVRHIPYRLAHYGEVIRAGDISIRFISPIHSIASTVVRVDMRDVSLIIPGIIKPKELVQLKKYFDPAVFTTSFQFMPKDYIVGLTYLREHWLQTCQNKTDLLFWQHVCMNK